MGRWQKEAVEGIIETYAEYVDTVTLGGSGTETAFTFADQDLPDMSGTAYQVFLNANDALTTLNVLAASKATSGFTIEHDDASTATVDVFVKGVPAL